MAWGSLEKKLGTGGLEGWPGRRWTGGGDYFRGQVERHTAGREQQGAAVWPVVAGGSGGWRLKMNFRPLTSYPTAAKSTDQR